MRLLALVMTCASLGACGTSAPVATATPTQSEQALMRDGEWRQRQVMLDTQAILAGMARAQAETQSGARTAR